MNKKDYTDMMNKTEKAIKLRERVVRLNLDTEIIPDIFAAHNYNILVTYNASSIDVKKYIANNPERLRRVLELIEESMEEELGTLKREIEEL